MQESALFFIGEFKFLLNGRDIEGTVIPGKRHYKRGSRKLFFAGNAL